MDWKEFISEVISHIAWPMTALLMLYTLKEKISDVLPRLEKLKHKETEISFSKAMQGIVDTAAEAEVENAEISPDLEEEEARLRSLVDFAANRVIHQTFSLVDRELLNIDDLALKGSNRAPLRIRDGMKIRKELGVDQDLQNKIIQLHKVRREVMQNPKEAISSKQALSFVELGIYVTSKLREFIANREIKAPELELEALSS